MQPTLCSKCKKNVAVIFVTKIENGITVNEGLCLKCAKELNIKAVDDAMKKLGVTDEDLDSISEEMRTMFEEADNAKDLELVEEDDEEDIGKTATFPFLNKLFDMSPQSGSENAGGHVHGENKRDMRQKAPNKRKFLENYCISLSNKALNGKIDRIVGRDDEIERVIQILNRRQKNNPCLIGEPGVGKTAIAEGLAMRICEGNVPYKLKDKEVYLLDLTALVAGTQFRGQFESRMKNLIDEIKKQGNIILVIDEVHNIVGAGEAEGAMNAANILKPALSRGEIQVIGATTFSEYRKHIEKDTALERRFQPVTVNEPSIEESVDIVKGIAHYYEQFHGVRITDEMARQAVILSERYITDRYLPDKAIDIIDEACSDVNLKNKDITRKDILVKERADLGKERELLLQDTGDENYARLAEIRSREMQIGNELAVIEAKGMPELTLDNLAHVIELWTKIPARNICEDEHERISKLSDRLKKHVIGQDEAVDAVCAAIKRGRAGVSPKRKPISFIFVGSTGVGKTELVKRLAADMFDSPESLIRLDMSEFMEKHAVSRLIGSPPGYVGYDEAGQLTEKIRRKPYSVILFDELEKAHPDVLNILLQILDDGRVTDAHGRTVNFENTVIIMTTNAGSSDKSASVGFDRTVNEQGREKSIKALEDFLRPEFINRVDEIVYFNKLTEDNFKAIAGLMVDEMKQHLDERGIKLFVDESAITYLANKSYSLKYGARNLRRLIQKEVEDRVASLIIDSYDSKLLGVSITERDGELQVTSV